MTRHGLRQANRSGPRVVRPTLLRQFACSIHSISGTGPKSCFKESAPGHAASWSPAVEIEWRDDNLVITAELPGLGLEDIKVEAIGNVLILQGERRRDRAAGRRTVGRSERGCGYFYREIVLPDGVDAAGAG